MAPTKKPAPEAEGTPAERLVNKTWQAHAVIDLMIPAYTGYDKERRRPPSSA